MKWDDVTLTILSGMAGELLSGTQIAQRFGVTRSAVLGKAKRMGIKLKSRSFDRTGVRKRDPASRADRSPARQKTRMVHSPPTMPAPSIPFAAGKTLIDLEPGECHYPSGDGPYIFCAAPVDGDCSYCLQHKRVAYREETAK